MPGSLPERSPGPSQIDPGSVSARPQIDPRSTANVTTRTGPVRRSRLDPTPAPDASRTDSALGPTSAPNRPRIGSGAARHRERARSPSRMRAWCSALDDSCHCPGAVPALHWHCTCTVLALCRHCAGTVPLMYWSSTGASLELYATLLDQRSGTGVVQPLGKQAEFCPTRAESGRNGQSSAKSTKTVPEPTTSDSMSTKFGPRAIWANSNKGRF